MISLGSSSAAIIPVAVFMILPFSDVNFVSVWHDVKSLATNSLDSHVYSVWNWLLSCMYFTPSHSSASL